MMEYPIVDMEDLSVEDLGVKLDAEQKFSVQIKGYTHILTGDDLITEMKDQLDVRRSVRNALLRKAQKIVLSGLKRDRLRMSEDEREVFDLNVLIWFADKVLNGTHESYLAK